MVLAALVRDGGGEQNHVAVPHERVDEALGVLGRDVLGDFERLHEVEAPAEVERRRQVVRDEAALVDQQAGLARVIAVDRHAVGRALRQPLGQPRALPGPYVEPAFDGHGSPDQRQDGLRREPRAGIDVVVEVGVIHVRHGQSFGSISLPTW